MNPNPAQVLQLRDIHLPAPPPLWPPAPGWWIVAGLLLVLLAWLTARAARHYRTRRRRRIVLAELASLEQQLASQGTPDALARMSALLRRVALMRFPREQVAALTGSAWLRFLDESGGDGRFTHGPGRVLAAGPYQRSLPSELAIRELAALLRHWLDRNIGSLR
jgi:hypothetical protein